MSFRVLSVTIALVRCVRGSSGAARAHARCGLDGVPGAAADVYAGPVECFADRERRAAETGSGLLHVARLSIELDCVELLFGGEHWMPLSASPAFRRRASGGLEFHAQLDCLDRGHSGGVEGCSDREEDEADCVKVRDAEQDQAQPVEDEPWVMATALSAPPTVQRPTAALALCFCLLMPRLRRIDEAEHARASKDAAGRIA
jgi:hypothetical protein